MTTFRLRLKKISKPKHARLKFDLEKLKDPNLLETFQAMIGRRFAPFTVMSNEDTDIDSMITTFNDLVLANTFGHHKASRRWTWHSPDGQHHNQIDYILVRKRFRSGVNIARTRSFPGADIGSDHDLLMMIFSLRLKKKNQQAKTQTHI